MVQPDLFHIILLFRTYSFAVTTDIEKMYRQVIIKTKYQSLQRVIWHDSPNQLIRCLQLSTATYGTHSSFLSTQTLTELVRDKGAIYPLGAEAILSKSYVDDIVTGMNDSSKVTKPVKRSIENGTVSHCINGILIIQQFLILSHWKKETLREKRFCQSFENNMVSANWQFSNRFAWYNE